MAASPSIADLQIRPAAAVDAALIQRMVRGARLDPTQLRWSNFLIAEIDGAVVGIGQVRRHRTCKELGSLVVTRDYRQRGVASALMAALEAQAGLPLYLMCEASLESFYRRFGYHTIGYWETPGTLRLKRTFTLLFRIFGVRILAMRKD